MTAVCVNALPCFSVTAMLAPSVPCSLNWTFCALVSPRMFSVQLLGVPLRCNAHSPLFSGLRRLPSPASSGLISGPLPRSLLWMCVRVPLQKSGVPAGGAPRGHCWRTDGGHDLNGVPGNGMLGPRGGERWAPARQREQCILRPREGSTHGGAGRPVWFTRVRRQGQLGARLREFGLDPESISAHSVFYLLPFFPLLG